MEERRGEAFAGPEQFTVMGRHLHPGDPAPDFSLDLADMAIRTVGLADSAGMARLLNVVNSLERHK